MIVPRRLLGIIIDGLVWGIFSIAVLYRNEQSDFLYAYNGQHLGLTAMVFFFVICETLLGYTPGRAIVRVRIASADYMTPRVSQRLTRSLSFWMLLLAASVFMPPKEVLPGDAGDQIVAMLAVSWTLASGTFLLPITNERRGLHEYVSNTRTISSSVSVSEELSKLPIITLKIGKLPTSALLALFVFFASGVLVVDWKVRLGSRLQETYESSGTLLHSSVGCPECGTRKVLAIQRLFETSDRLVFGYVHDYVIFRDGRSVAITLLLPERVVRDELLSQYQAIHYIIAVGSDIPPDIRWIDLHLQSRTEFGFFHMTKERRYIFDPLKPELVPFPTIEPYAEKAGGELVFRPKIYRTLSAMPFVGAWNPRRFNFWRDWNWGAPILDSKPATTQL